MYKNKNVKTKSVQSSSWFWWLQLYSTQLEKKKKDETCKIKHRPPKKKLHLYSISSRALFVQFQFDTWFNYMLPKRSHRTCAVLLRLRWSSILTMRPCWRASLCVLVSVALTLVSIFLLHNTIQVHRSLSANTCRDEPTGEKTGFELGFKLNYTQIKKQAWKGGKTSSSGCDFCPKNREHKAWSHQTVSFGSQWGVPEVHTVPLRKFRKR